VVLASFGDMLRVPGSAGSMEVLRAQGVDARVVYSPMEALELAASLPHREVVFFGVGFETTAPASAAVLLEAQRRQIPNFSLFSAHKRIPPALALLASAPDLAVDGFLCPGHVSVVLGLDAYAFLAEEHHVPCVVAGFEATDILEGIRMLVAQIGEGRAAVENQYGRVVRREGNPKARRLMEEAFLPADAAWRGIGVIPESGLAIRPQLSPWDARKKFAAHLEWRRFEEVPEPKACRCGEVLKGVATPRQCGLFGDVCTPAHPVGPCMVSSEGTCAAYYRYGLT
jgi:hydrogenase expression/formation protein HypD